MPRVASQRPRSIGNIIRACAKMIGMTPAALIFSGRYWRTPPYCLLPMTRFAYCTGTLRTACTMAMAAMMTRNQMTSSTTRMRGPPTPLPWNFWPISATRAYGRRATIPIMMIREIPLPIPRSVMRSPSHITNMVPAIRMMVDTRLKVKLLQPTAMALRGIIPVT